MMRGGLGASVLAALVGAAMSTPVYAAGEQPYAGQETREIASLSAQDQEDLRAGRGWGFALAAELNGYPGPAHILELSDELELSEAQRRDVQAIFDAMNARARELGAAFIAAEASLDAAFADGSVTPDGLRKLTGAAGRLRAELRAVHLAAHIEATPILTRHQRMVYAQLRGYAGGAGHGGHGGHAHD